MQLPWTVDAGLLFILAIPVVMNYRILPVDGTPYWLFGILFLLLTLNIFISLFANSVSRYFSVAQVKTVILWLVMAITVGGATVTAIADRHRIAPAYLVHDIILQQEAAIRYLVHGKNPYKETYFGTPVESFRYDELGSAAVNPALYHFVMPPWYLLFPLVFYTPANHTVGYFDGRIVSLFALAGTLFVLEKIIKNQKLKLIAVSLAALSPGVVDYFIEGRSDIFALFWFILAILFLEKRNFFISSLVFGLALISKQTIWFALPFFAIFLWLKNNQSLKNTVKYMLISGGTALIFTAPFLVWDYRAFVDSVLLYLSGNTAHGYPVSGYGFGMVLYKFGIIKDIHAYFPFIFLQILFGIPVILVSLWWLMKKPSISRLIFGYGISLLVVWYFSRYLNNSHLAYVSTLFMLAILKDWDEKITA